MSISDKSQNKALIRRIYVWLGISVFCLVFYLIYNMFSHGVKSPYMTYLFAWPLILGFLPCIIIYVISRIKHSVIHIDAVSDNAFCSGAAALTVSSLLKGIFDIAGTASVYQTWLSYAGAALIIIGIIHFIIVLLKA